MDNQPKLKQDLDEEKRLFEEPFYIDSNHWTANPLFVSRERHWLKYEVSKLRFYGLLYRYISHKPYKHTAKILLAPIGDGLDLKYLEGIYKCVEGIDISDVQLAKCPRSIATKNADILNSGYKNESFDIIIVPFFLHHLHEVGFEPFISEFYRLLRKGGTIAILEPSALYPPSWFIALLSQFIGKMPAKTDNEMPVIPFCINKALKQAGFMRIKIHGMTNNHVAFPVFLQNIINLIDYPLRAIWPFKLFSESIGYFAEKI